MSVAGGPDLTIGVGGYVQLPKTLISFDSSYTARASAPQANGDLVVVGNAITVSDADPAIPGNFLVARYNTNGTIDSTFNSHDVYIAPALQTDGEAASSFPDPTDAGATGVAVLPGGQILVVGNAAGSTTPGAPLAAKLVLLNSDGSLDTSFGTGGVVTLGTVGAGDSMLDYASAVSLLPGGLIAVGGATEPTAAGPDTPAVEVLNADGSVDTGYGTAGLATLPVPSNAQAWAPIVPQTVVATGGGAHDSTAGPVSMVVTPRSVAMLGGEVAVEANAVLTGGTSVESVVTLLTTAGVPDATFGTAGQATIAPRSVFPTATLVSGTALAVQPDGYLIVGGAVFLPDSPYRMVVVRLTTAGAFDTTFGVGGVNILPAATNLDGAQVGAIAVLEDGKIVLGDQLATDFARLNPDGSLDTTFGTDGQSVLGQTTVILVTGSNQPAVLQYGAVGLTITAAGKILVADATGAERSLLGQGAPNDFDGDGITDRAIYISSQGVVAYMPSTGVTGPIVPFGPPGAGQTLPAPGAYGGEGVDEPAIYIPSVGEFAILSIPTGQVVLAPFGLTGVGASLPAPGDYDKSGATELGIYAPSTGIYAYRPAGGGPDVYVQIGATGPGNSIPVPADYLGTGQDDVAVYEPATNSFLIQNPADGQVITIPFGVAGAGNSVPVPGDYDGSGHVELAVYLPRLGELVYRPANGSPDVIEPFGIAGSGATLPAPGDYDGSGRTELAGYLTGLGEFVYRPASGTGGDVSEQFGVANQTIPFVLASATDTGFPLTPSGSAIRASSVSVSAEVPLTPDVLATLDGTAARKKAGQG